MVEHEVVALGVAGSNPVVPPPLLMRLASASLFLYDPDLSWV